MKVVHKDEKSLSKVFIAKVVEKCNDQCQVKCLTLPFNGQEPQMFKKDVVSYKKKNNFDGCKPVLKEIGCTWK